VTKGQKNKKRRICSDFGGPRKIWHINDRLACWAESLEDLVEKVRESRRPRPWEIARQQYLRWRREKIAQGDKITRKDIRKLLSDSDYKCFYCRKEVKTGWTLDHFVPISRGGKHELANLRIACR